MSKIAKEMYKSTMRSLMWQAAEDLGPLDTTDLLASLLAEYTNELSMFAHEQGVVLTQPEQQEHVAPENTGAA